jgi:hypothetical protein
MDFLRTVINPSYYELPVYSVNDVAEAWRLCPHLFNIFKYAVRAYQKNGVQDIDKALVYLDRLETLRHIPVTTYIRSNIDAHQVIGFWEDHLTSTQKRLVVDIYLASTFRSMTYCRLIRRELLNLRTEILESQNAVIKSK